MRSSWIAILVFTALLTVSRSAVAHDGPHKHLGVVTMAAKDHVMIETPDGKKLTIALTTATKILKGKLVVKPTDITEGTRVVVTVKGDKPPYTASQVLVGVAAEAPKK